MGNNSDDMEMANKSPSPAADKVVAQGDEDSPPTPPARRDLKPKEDKSVVSEAPEQNKRRKIGSFPRPEVIYKPESTESCMTCLKNVLILFNLLIWLFGAALTGIGIWIKVDQEFWDIQTGLDMKQFTNAAYVLIAAGVFIMIIGFVGCYGAFAQSLCMLVVYAVVVILIILLEIAVMAVVWTASKNKEVKEEIKVKARKAIQEMAQEDNQRYFLDLMHAKLKCCGVDGPDDFIEEGVPTSCTNPDTGLPYDQGCLNSIVKYLEGKAGILGGIAIAVFILQLAALGLTLCLACAIKNAASNAIF